MFFDFLRTSPAEEGDDTATGTYADGAVGTPQADLSVHPRRRRLRGEAAQERIYGLARQACQQSAGMIA